MTHLLKKHEATTRLRKEGGLPIVEAEKRLSKLQKVKVGKRLKYRNADIERILCELRTPTPVNLPKIRPFRASLVKKIQRAHGI